MELTREEMLALFFERDPANDGRFVIGVVTTGIYCLPSCPARRPRPTNVRFFPDEPEARASGLRPCKRCRPDHFYRRYDPDRERVSALATHVRRRPGDFEGTEDLAAHAGVGITKLGTLFRRHYHTTPAVFLQRARVAHAARRLLAKDGKLLDAALDAGFESPSAFHEAFRRWMAMSPGAYQKLQGSAEFTLTLPDDYHPEQITSLFGRDPDGTTERVRGSHAAKALVLDGRAARLELELARGKARCRLAAPKRLAHRHVAAGHRAALRLLGLTMDPGPFERRAARTGEGRRLVRGCRGLRVPQSPDAFEGVVWVIVGQQVNLTFASQCRARLIELRGEPAGDGFLAHPTPEQVATLDYADLTRRQFSRRKAEYVVDTARAIAAGELDVEGLRTRPYAEVVETLGAVRGLGPWSIRYLCMRAFGFEDCVPVGDAGLVAGLQLLHGLDHRPDAAETERLMEPFAPHRSFATFHVWRRLGDPGDDA